MTALLATICGTLIVLATALLPIYLSTRCVAVPVGVPVEREAMPLGIWLHPDLSNWFHPTIRAAAFWNRGGGVALFNFLEGPNLPDDIVRILPLLDTGRPKPLTIYLDPRTDVLARDRVIARELGQILGLTRHCNPESAMYGLVLDTSFSLMIDERKSLQRWYG